MAELPQKRHLHNSLQLSGRAKEDLFELSVGFCYPFMLHSHSKHTEGIAPDHSTSMQWENWGCQATSLQNCLLICKTPLIFFFPYQVKQKCLLKFPVWLLEAKGDILRVVLCGEIVQLLLNLMMIWMYLLKVSRLFCMELNTKEKSTSSSGKHLRLSKCVKYEHRRLVWRLFPPTYTSDVIRLSLQYHQTWW